MFWEPGEPFRARDTITNRNCGIRPDSMGHVTYVSTGRISFYIDKSPPGAGSIEGTCPLDIFGANFEKCLAMPSNSAYTSYSHFSSEFPGKFLSTSR